jgi:hypothetical protein
VVVRKLALVSGVSDDRDGADLRYSILFHDTVVGLSTFELPFVLVGMAAGQFELAPAFEQLRPLLQAREHATPADDVDAERASEEHLDPMNPVAEQLPLRVADADGRVLSARICRLWKSESKMTTRVS